MLDLDEAVHIVGEQTATWLVRVVLGFSLKVPDFENLPDLVALFHGMLQLDGGPSTCPKPLDIRVIARCLPVLVGAFDVQRKHKLTVRVTVR